MEGLLECAKRRFPREAHLLEGLLRSTDTERCLAYADAARRFLHVSINANCFVRCGIPILFGGTTVLSFAIRARYIDFVLHDAYGGRYALEKCSLKVINRATGLEVRDLKALQPIASKGVTPMSVAQGLLRLFENDLGPSMREDGTVVYKELMMNLARVAERVRMNSPPPHFLLQSWHAHLPHHLCSSSDERC